MFKHIKGENNQCWYKLYRLHLGLIKFKLYICPNDKLFVIERRVTHHYYDEPWVDWKEVYRRYFKRKEHK